MLTRIREKALKGERLDRADGLWLLTDENYKKSLSAYLKHRVKNAVQFIANYERAVASEARRRGVDGVVCGHIHHAEIRTIDGILYCNDGDWVESCTALVEDFDGRLRIVHWAEEHARQPTLLPTYVPSQVAAE